MDLISRQAAIDAVEESRYLNHHQDGKEACAHEYEHRHFLKILRELPSTNQWIPVSERLPDNEAGEDWVVAVVREKDTGFCWIPRVMEYRARLNDWLFQNDNGWLSYERNKNFEVVAWMPLPEPYKGEE